MTFNPFQEKPVKIGKTFMDWEQIYPEAYRKEDTDPYTKCRIILMNGTEFEAQWFSRNYSRHCADNDVRRELAMIRRSEQQQQKRLSCLKPRTENMLETTIGYEQLAVDLTAALAKMEKDPHVIDALNFALLEDFDHLYRYSNLLNLEYGIYPETLTGGYSEITPGRPTIAEHRFPKDSIFQPIKRKEADLQTKLNIGIITAAEQQTMNFYMNINGMYPGSDIGRQLYQEIGMIEEQHVSQYESLMDPQTSWTECLLMHQYTECYLYYSCMMTETDERIRKIWEESLTQEIAHLHMAEELLKKVEGKDHTEVVGEGTFPKHLVLESNIDYVRNILDKTVGNTQKRSSIVPLYTLPDEDTFFRYQKIVNPSTDMVPSHLIIGKHQCIQGKDYRDEKQPNPVKELQGRARDNVTLGRVKAETPLEHSAAPSTWEEAVKDCVEALESCGCEEPHTVAPKHQAHC